MPIVVPDHLESLGGYPTYKANQDKAKSKGGHPLGPEECCVLCGKACLAHKTYVALTNVNEYTTKEEMAVFDEECEARGACSDDLGLYPVGADCMKKLTMVGVTIYDRAFNVVLAPKVEPVLKDRD